MRMRGLWLGLRSAHTFLVRCLHLVLVRPHCDRHHPPSHRCVAHGRPDAGRRAGGIRHGRGHQRGEPGKQPPDGLRPGRGYPRNATQLAQVHVTQAARRRRRDDRSRISPTTTAGGLVQRQQQARRLVHVQRPQHPSIRILSTGIQRQPHQRLQKVALLGRAGGVRGRTLHNHHHPPMRGILLLPLPQSLGLFRQPTVEQALHQVVRPLAFHHHHPRGRRQPHVAQHEAFRANHELLCLVQSLDPVAQAVSQRMLPIIQSNFKRRHFFSFASSSPGVLIHPNPEGNQNADHGGGVG